MGQTATAKKGASFNVQKIINDRIIEQLEKGIVPWQKPWTEVPKNLISKRPYGGINVMLLATSGYERNFFLTANQLADIGGSIKPNEKPHMIVFWNNLHKDAGVDTDDEKKTTKLRYYSVYNIAQCVGISPEFIPEQTKEDNPSAACDRVIFGILNGPNIKYKDPNPYYDPLEDIINMRKIKNCENEAQFYSMFFHQLVHSTGHHTRCDRMGLVQMAEFGCEFSQEELVTDIATCYLQNLTGIGSQIEYNQETIDRWIQKFQNDRQFIFTASTLAQKAIDFILNIQNEVDEKTVVEETAIA